MARGLPDETKTIPDAACTACGCVCDDIALKVRGRRVVEAENACGLGNAWFLNQGCEDLPPCLIAGRPAAVEAGVCRAAEILAEARYPLVYGLGNTASEAQRVAVGIADWIGGTLDTTAGVSFGPAAMAMQRVGAVASSLGEVLHRGDLIVFWGCDPAESHPRHFNRYSLMPKGLWTPRGRDDRTCVVVDVQNTRTAEAADIFLQITPGRDLEAIWTLRALAKGVDIDPRQVEDDTGIPLAAWQDLIQRMKRSRYGAIFFGTGLTTTCGQHLNSEALFALVRDMNASTRFVCAPMHKHGNAAGADNVVTWQTGYPFGVNFSRGYPRFNPGEYTAVELLSRCEADAAMILAADPMDDFPEAARRHLASIPFIALDPKETETTRQATVTFHVAAAGINVAGTVYRMDGVPIPLRPAFDSPLPSDLEILQEIERRVRPG